MTAASEPRVTQTVNPKHAHQLRPNSSALWPNAARPAGPACRSSDASVLTALMSAVEPQQPGYLSPRDAAAAPLDRFPQRQTLIVSHRPQRLPSALLSVPD
jgi:hypothetical protein